MYKSRLWGAVSACILSMTFSTLCQAAVIYDVDSGKLTGIRNVDVGEPYTMCSS